MCIWKVMADSFDFDDIEITQLVYQNYPVKRFMDAKQSMGISACKGMGKTFLLKAKRMRLQKENDSSILFLPKNQLVDAPAPCVLDQTHISFLKSYNNWVALWIGCISIYFVINSSEVFANKEQIKRLKHFCAAVDGNENERNVFLSSTGFDLSETRREISNYLKAAGYRVFAYEDDDFPPLKATGDPNQLHHQGETHDHCINVMLSCKHLIYIFAGRFGGQYFGNEFESYYKERSDIIKICPSISFMEYLVANKLGKSVSVYVYEKVEDARGEWTKNGSPNDYKSRVVDDIRVFKQLGYFNSLGNGTWLNKYYDYSSLVNAIKKRFPTIQN